MLIAVKTKIKSLVDRLADYVLDRDAHNIHRALQRQALGETAAFVAEHLYLTRSYRNKFELLDAALQAAPKTAGLVCEFGVYSGATINFIAGRVTGPVHGFDSFEGLPEDWRPGVEKGTFRVDALPRVRNNVTLVKGWFDQSLPGFLREHREPCTFLHIDCDLYSSTKIVFDCLGDRIAAGTVLVFDEFFNYPGWRKGEYQAFQELAAAQRLQFEYLGYVANDEQVAVRITGKS